MRRFVNLSLMICVALVGCTSGVKISRENLAMNKLRKAKWMKAHAILRKAIRKDSMDIAAKYLLGTYFITPENPAYQIDSAYAYTMEGLRDYVRLPSREKDRLKRLPLDSALMIRQREQIDSVAFDRAKTMNTEVAYLAFYEQFPYARQLPQARELRDESAYLDALKENTWEAYLDFLTKYPSAGRAEEARSRYDKLLFEARTKSKKLADYRSFISEYPDSPYRAEVEKQIFEISTASGEATRFREFLDHFPNASIASRAAAILYYLAPEMLPRKYRSDSLNAVIRVQGGYLVPFLSGDHFGFMNQDGKDVIGPLATSIDTTYRCGDVTDDLLLMNDKLYSRKGVAIIHEKVNAFDDIGLGFLLVETKNGSMVIHKSGFSVAATGNTDARVVGQFLAIKKKTGWSLWTLSGRMLLPYEYDAIFIVGDGLALQKNGIIHLCHMNDIAAIADQQPLREVAAFDEIKTFADSLYWVRMGERQGVINRNFSYWIPPNPYAITAIRDGALVKHQVGVQLYNYEGATVSADSAIVQARWTVIRRNRKWRLLSEGSYKESKETMDSISFSGPLLVDCRPDSLRIYFSHQHSIEIGTKTAYRFLPGKDSVFFLSVESGNEKVIYDSQSRRLFGINADKIDYAGENYFWINRKGKIGLVDQNGKVILPAEYDAIGNPLHGEVAVLRDKLFGYVDVVNSRIIKPAFQKNLKAYNNDCFIAFKDGNCGIVNWRGDAVVPFDFEEIQYWTDTAALIKKNFQWMIYDLKHQSVLMNRIREITWLKNTLQEKLIIVRQDNDKGVISNQKGVIVPISFSDIVNLGSPDDPLYFTDKFVEEASIHVVIYYDRSGTQLKRQVLEADDYKRIHCLK